MVGQQGISRQTLLESINCLSADAELSLSELSEMFDVKHNTVRGHFSNGRFPEIRRGGRAKRVYDKSTAKAYGMWLYLSKDSDCVLNFPAVQRDKLLEAPGVDALWEAFERSDADLIQVVSS